MSDRNQGKIIAVAGNQTTLADTVEALLDEGYAISYVLNVGPEKAHMIAGYVDYADFAREHRIELIRPPTYAMTDPASREMLQGARIDLLISVAWQRLIPEWLLERLEVGAFGMHGSSEPLPRGRGRSPLNWSIIEGRDRFLTNLFRYDPGVDSGTIVGTQPFDISPRDTIRSLQHKNNLARIALLKQHLPLLLTGRATFTPQPTDVKPTYYPQRVPEDGVIDWRDTAERIDRIVRAVTRPYPGAFTFEAGRKVLIWQGAPFDTSLRFDAAAAGEIAAAFHDGTFLVRCGDDSFYVTDWEGEGGWRPQAGAVLESRTNPSWAKLEQMYHDA